MLGCLLIIVLKFKESKFLGHINYLLPQAGQHGLKAFIDIAIEIGQEVMDWWNFLDQQIQKTLAHIVLDGLIDVPAYGIIGMELFGTKNCLNLTFVGDFAGALGLVHFDSIGESNHLFKLLFVFANDSGFTYENVTLEVQSEVQLTLKD